MSEFSGVTTPLLPPKYENTSGESCNDESQNSQTSEYHIPQNATKKQNCRPNLSNGIIGLQLRAIETSIQKRDEEIELRCEEQQQLQINGNPTASKEGNPPLYYDIDNYHEDFAEGFLGVNGGSLSSCQTAKKLSLQMGRSTDHPSLTDNNPKEKKQERK